MAPERFDHYEAPEFKDMETVQDLKKLETNIKDPTDIEKKFLHNPLDQILSPEEKKYFDALNNSKPTPSL